MNYQITLNIAEDSAEAQLIEKTAAMEQLSREEAALKLIKNSLNEEAAQPQNNTEQTEEEQRLAAIERFTGHLKDEEEPKRDSWWHHFNEEHYADIERENQRNLV